MEELVAAVKKLKGKGLLLTHHNADLDAVSSALGLKYGLGKFGLEMDIGVAESVSRAGKKLLGSEEIIVDPDCSKYDWVFLVETSVPEQLASVKNLRVDLILDHHPAGPLVKGAKAVWIDEKEKAAALMVFRLLKVLGVEITAEVAKVLLAGIVADTAHLRLAERGEFLAVAELLGTGVRFADVLNTIEGEVDFSERVAVLRALGRIEVYRLGELLVCFTEIGSFESQTARALVKAGADIAFVFDRKKEELRVSSRAKKSIEEKGIDLSKMFIEVGKIIGGTGGGHPTAGSANGRNVKAIPEVIEFLLGELEKVYGRAERLE